MTLRLRNWHEGTPDVGRVVWVWHFLHGVMHGVWDGAHWRTMEGDALYGVEWWHEL